MRCLDKNPNKRPQTALELGKGMLAVTAHFGNWERFAQYARSQGRQVYAVARDAACWQLGRSELEVWEFLSATEEIARRLGR